MTSTAPGELARRAWEELYVRHRRYLFVVVRRCYGAALDDDGLIDLVVDTLRRAYGWARRQTNADDVRKRFTGPDSDSTRRRVLGWLGAIAKQLFLDGFQVRRSSAAEFSRFLEDHARAHEHTAEQDDPARLELLETALASLNPDETDALRVSLPWYDLETRSFAVPRNEASRLASLLHTTTENLRQRRHRAIKKLEKHLLAEPPVESSRGVSE
jgi:hypothetical protein